MQVNEVDLVLYSFRENMPSHFKFKEYCPMVFRNLRERFGIDDQDFQVSSSKCLNQRLYGFKRLVMLQLWTIRPMCWISYFFYKLEEKLREKEGILSTPSPPASRTFLFSSLPAPAVFWFLPLAIFSPLCFPLEYLPVINHVIKTGGWYFLQ